ncbi:MAG: sigma-54-dependent Fis family transcriptional regulator, partial [Deltaproteobacteria bacterium]|nr:sigma-54-dependent Fis family transcriptional regulator [Deltaproteobacteria bacterium]
NKDLNKAVKSGDFREDLFYRLNVFPIHVPPLRERKDDISLLANYFLKLFSSKTGKEIVTLSQADLSSLAAYNWPGNVRELENVIERGTILATGSVFKMPELTDAGPECTIPFEAVTLKEMERRHILWVLDETGGKIGGNGGAAEILDIHPNTLHSRMKKLGIGKRHSSPYR